MPSLTEPIKLQRCLVTLKNNAALLTLATLLGTAVTLGPSNG